MDMVALFDKLEAMFPGNVILTPIDTQDGVEGIEIGIGVAPGAGGYVQLFPSNGSGWGRPQVVECNPGLDPETVAKIVEIVAG